MKNLKYKSVSLCDFHGHDYSDIAQIIHEDLRSRDINTQSFSFRIEVEYVEAEDE